MSAQWAAVSTYFFEIKTPPQGYQILLSIFDLQPKAA